MRKDKQTFKVQGMTQDESVSSENNIKGNPDKAYEIRNMRFCSSEFDNSLVLNNEKGTEAIEINDMYELEGVPLGTATVGKYMILFTKSDSFDYIYRLEKIENNRFKADVIAKGYFNFENRIETISYYENEKMLKVYWIDGKNCLRVMNILSNKIIESSKMIDSTPICIQDNISIVIDKRYDSSGVFSPGTIQYMFTYANKFLVESNIFYQSALYYCNSSDNVCDSPESTSTCSFKVILDNLDSDFEYLNCYSVSRSSADGTPSVKLVKQLKIPENGHIEFVDTNTNSIQVDFTELSSHTNVALIPDTFAVKANTMFIGNARYDNEEISFTHDDFKANFKDFGYYLKDDLYDVSLKGYYPHVNQTTKNNRYATTFKTRETYRFGVQFQHQRGYWSEVFWLGDYGNGIGDMDFIPPHVNVNGNNGSICTPAFKGTLDKNIINDMIDNGFVKARPVVVYPDENDREILCQGIINPTVFNYAKRNSNNIFSQSSWFFRPEALVNAIEDSNGGNFMYNQKAVDPKDKSKRVVLQYDHYKCLPDNSNYNSEIQCNLYHTPNFNSAFFGNISDEKKKKNDLFYQDSFFVDRSIFTVNSPEIDIEETLSHGQRLGYKFRVVGLINIDSVVGGYRVIEPQTSNTFRDDPYSLARGLYDGRTFQYIKNVDDNVPCGPVASFLMWSDEVCNPADGISNPEGVNSKSQYYEYGFMTYPWHRDGCLNNDKHSDTSTGGFKSKILSNMRYSVDTAFMDDPIDIELEDTVSWSDATEIPVGLRINDEVKLYSGSVDDVVNYGLGDYAGGQLEDKNVVLASVYSCDSFLKYLALGADVALHFLSLRCYIKKVKSITENDMSSYPAKDSNSFPMFKVYYFKVGNMYKYILDASERNGKFKRYDGKSYFSDDIEYGWDEDSKETGSNTYQFTGQGNWCSYYCSYEDSNITLVSTAAIVKAGIYARVGLESCNGENVTLRILGRYSQGGNGRKKEDMKISLIAREISSKQSGYPIVCTGPNKIEESPYSSVLKPVDAKMTDNWNYMVGKEAVIMRYSSRPHLVSSIKNNYDSTIQKILPSIQNKSLNIEDKNVDDSDYSYEIPDYGYDDLTSEAKSKYNELSSKYDLKNAIINENTTAVENFEREWTDWCNEQERIYVVEKEETITKNTIERKVVLHPFWDMGKSISECKPIGDLNSFFQSVMDKKNTERNNVMMIGEYYKDNDNKFGGTSQESLETNIWCVGGEAVDIKKDNDVELRWTEGDTYYQRYDCVKTLPYNELDRNQIVEMMSFMVETHINLDGRYDNRQGQVDNTTITNSNVNKINKSYTQSDNIFTYTAFSDDDINADEFHNNIFWSDKKINGEKIDKWTNINVMNSISSDNIYGRLVKLVSNGIGLYAINEGSVSKILYNESAAVNDPNGNAVLFGINDMVNGIVVLDNSYGCQNKWSVVDYEDTILFVDNNSRSHLAVSQDRVTDISYTLGMKSWFSKNNVYGSSYFDKVNREVMYITEDDCLMFGNVRGSATYTGFFDYADALFENYSGDGIFVTSDGDRSRLWLKNKGSYNSFFGDTKSYHVTYKVNDYSTVEKIFTNVEFRSSTSYFGDDVNETFDTIRCWNEYQDTLDEDIVFDRFNISDMKRKFRIWRANIGRHKNISDSLRKNLDRINGTWAFIKIEKQYPSYEKTILNDFESVFYACDDATFNDKAQNDQDERMKQLYRGDI